MNNSSPQKELPIERNNSYAGDNGHVIVGSTELQEDQRPYKKAVRYKECLKNHAAAIGGNATDGCGEFLPSGEEGSLEALKCSACNCHRNFHRKETEGECSSDEYFHSPTFLNNGTNKLILGSPLAPPPPQGYPTTFLISPRATAPHHHHHHLHHAPIIMPYRNGSAVVPSESDEKDDEAAAGGGIVVGAVRHNEQKMKRFRTKFTQEQKEKMLSFAEKAGWKIQKLEESVVQQFCQEIGIKRRVLKVWMHNNKNSLAKKNFTLL